MSMQEVIASILDNRQRERRRIGRRIMVAEGRAPAAVVRLVRAAEPAKASKRDFSRFLLPYPLGAGYTVQCDPTGTIYAERRQALRRARTLHGAELGV